MDKHNIQSLSKSLGSELTISKIGSNKDGNKQANASTNEKSIGVATKVLPKTKDAAASTSAGMPRLQIRKSIHDREFLRATKSKQMEANRRLKPVTKTTATSISGAESTAKAARSADVYRKILDKYGNKSDAPSTDTSKSTFAAQITKQIANAIGGTYAVNTAGILPAEQIISYDDQTVVRITTNSKPDLVMLNRLLPNVQVDTTATPKATQSTSAGTSAAKSSPSNSAFRASPFTVTTHIGTNTTDTAGKETPKSNVRISNQTANNEKKSELKIPSEITASKVIKRTEPPMVKTDVKRLKPHTEVPNDSAKSDAKSSPIIDLTTPTTNNIDKIQNKPIESVIKPIKSYPASSSLTNKLCNNDKRSIETTATKSIDNKTVTDLTSQAKFLLVDQKTNNTFITVKPLANLQKPIQSHTAVANTLLKSIGQPMQRSPIISSVASTSSLLSRNQRPNKTPTKLSAVEIQKNLLKVYKDLGTTRANPRRTEQRAKSMHYTYENTKKPITRATFDNDWNSLTEALSSSAAQIKKPSQQPKMIDVSDVCIDLEKLTREQLMPKEPPKMASQKVTGQRTPVQRMLIQKVPVVPKVPAQNVPAQTIRKSLTSAKSGNKIVDDAPPAKIGRLSLPFLTNLGDAILWSRQNRNGILPQSTVSFGRNEFGMVELNSDDKCLRNESLPNRGRPSNRRKSELAASCNHTNFDDCFNAVIARLGKHLQLNQTTVEHTSKEFKELIRGCVRKRNQRCTAVTFAEIQDALNKSPHFGNAKLNKASIFNWEFYVQQYVRKTGNQLPMAPANFFFNSSTDGANPFVIGHKLEAIDPMNCSLYCVCTVADVRGHRIKLHFDGYHSAYDFWTNANSQEIFPIHYCARTARHLHPPFGHNKFIWSHYLAQTSSSAAPESCFRQLNLLDTTRNPFKIDMKLEAEDINGTGKLCVATVKDVIGDRVLITFDEMPKSSQFWTDINAPCIHPVNWHLAHDCPINSPPNYKKIFVWEEYLIEKRATAVPHDAFSTRNSIKFKPGMLLEVVDKGNPALIRPARIRMVDDYKIKLVFLEWDEKYAFWMDDDSSDLHQINWARKTGHPIEPPLDPLSPRSSTEPHCSTRHCHGTGNYRYPAKSTHTTADECPYESKNWPRERYVPLPNRLGSHALKAPVVPPSTGKTFRSPNIPNLLRTEGIRTNTDCNNIGNKILKNPPELADMKPIHVEAYRRLQVNSRHVINKLNNISSKRDKWLEKLKPMHCVEISGDIKNPLKWTIEEVAKFVSNLPNCVQAGRIFTEHEIDGLAFLQLRRDDMTNRMGLSLGVAIKIFSRIGQLREECNVKFIQYD